MATQEAVDKFRDFFIRNRQKSGVDNHFTALNFTVVDIQSGKAHMSMPSTSKIAGNPVTGAVASGPVFALLDTCCAMAAATCGDEIKMCPTLDLRVDFLGAPKPDLTIHAEATAFRNSRYVVFTEGFAYQDDKEKPIARCSINFTPIDQKVMVDHKAKADSSTQQGDGAAK